MWGDWRGTVTFDNPDGNHTPSTNANLKHGYAYDLDLHKNESAAPIASLLFEIINPHSVIDFGCGKGQFLKAFKNLGTTEVLGYDGPWAREHNACNLTDGEFISVDFERPDSIPNKQADLAISFEVAEHLMPEKAHSFIAKLTQSADVIAFSAALPFQGGQNHVNEQPLEYWINLFIDQGFLPYDVIRPVIWNNESIEVWYRQNICLFIRQGNPLGQKVEDWFANQNTAAQPRTMVHPSFYALRMREYQSRLDQLYEGGIKPTSYLYLLGKSILRKLSINPKK